MQTVRERLVPWFNNVARDLPWRRTKDPYRIWLSEIMLQQTRVDQAESYYNRFASNYPTIDSLAAAQLDGVLRDWEGLGYYARARNMHRAAQLIVREMDSVFPADHKSVIGLPGVGPYTAAAIMSIAYGEPYAVVDGNVTRVISRLFEIGDDPSSSKGKNLIQQLADDLLDERDPGRFNEAIMELGATVCAPRNPQCDECPVNSACAAFASGRTAEFPIRRKRRPVPHHQIAVAVLVDDDRVFIQKRAEDGLLGGLWEFPGGKIEGGESPEEGCRREVREELGVEVETGAALSTIEHAYSHFKVTLHPFVCRLVAGDPVSTLDSRWARFDELDSYAFPRANRRLIELLIAHRSGTSGLPGGGAVLS
ncbi:MAG: A/G-specific adenine glycosylase [Rhodothermales bacterium]|nr:A/G-specific adenine glycosylase [Rhodothermales bacterium]